MRIGPSALLPWFGPSAALHAALGALLAAASCQEPRRSTLEKDAFLVSAVVLPKSDGLPTRAAAPRQREAGDAPRVTPKPVATPPPRLPDEMVLNTPDAPSREGPTPSAAPEPTPSTKPTRDRSDALAAVAEEADEVRFDTSPDGDPNAAPDAGLKARFGRQLTAYERQVKDAIQQNWFPKASSGEPADATWTAVTFSVDEQGNILDPALEVGSGDFVYDQSCLRAVQRTRRVPPPPPDAARTITVGFSPADKP